jgi:hypothetical protein
MKTKTPRFLTLAALGGLIFAQSTLFAQSLLLTAEDFVLLAGTDVTVAGPGPNVFSN